MTFHPAHRQPSRRTSVAALAVILLLLAALYLWAFERGRDRGAARQDVAPPRALTLPTGAS